MQGESSERCVEMRSHCWQFSGVVRIFRGTSGAKGIHAALKGGPGRGSPLRQRKFQKIYQTIDEKIQTLCKILWLLLNLMKIVLYSQKIWKILEFFILLCPQILIIRKYTFVGAQDEASEFTKNADKKSIETCKSFRIFSKIMPYF